MPIPIMPMPNDLPFPFNLITIDFLHMSFFECMLVYNIFIFFYFLDIYIYIFFLTIEIGEKEFFDDK